MTVPLQAELADGSGAPIVLEEIGELAGITRLEPKPVSRASRAATQKRAAVVACLLGDLVAVVVALDLGQSINATFDPRITVEQAARSAVYLPLFLGVIACYGLYRRAWRRLEASSFPDFSHLVHAVLVASLAMFALSGPLHRLISLPSVSRAGAATVGALALVLIPQSRALARWLAIWGTATTQSRVLIVGSGLVANHIQSRLATMSDLKVVGWVDDAQDPAAAPSPDVPRLGGVDDITHVVDTWGVDHVVVAFSPTTGASLAATLRSLPDDVRLSVVPRLFDLLSVRSRVDDVRGMPVIDVAPACLGPADRFAKRALDLVVSTAGLLLLAPFLLAIAMAIKVTSDGPVLFSQERTGRNGRAFRIHKFRTMRHGSDDERNLMQSDTEGPIFKLYEDPRVTSIGRFLRRTSIDEFPQLINVLKGEMSLVGPRPFIPSQSAEIGGWAEKRFAVRPGMTGLWQVCGRNDLPFDELCRLDYSYASSWSLWWDLKILWHTPGILLHRQGAY